jgi:hypothetical protein
MGIHYVFGYVGEEQQFLDTFITLLDNHCSHCHTNEDVGGDCARCPVGQLVLASRKYLLEAYESNICTDDAKIIRKIKREIKKIYPEPMFSSSWVFSREQSQDVLQPLRRLKSELAFANDEIHRRFRMQQDVRESIFKKVDAEMNRLKRSKK